MWRPPRPHPRLPATHGFLSGALVAARRRGTPTGGRKEVRKTESTRGTEEEPELFRQWGGTVDARITAPLGIRPFWHRGPCTRRRKAPPPPPDLNVGRGGVCPRMPESVAPPEFGFSWKPTLRSGGAEGRRSGNKSREPCARCPPALLRGGAVMRASTDQATTSLSILVDAPV